MMGSSGATKKQFYVAYWVFVCPPGEVQQMCLHQILQQILQKKNKKITAHEEKH